MHLLVWNYFQLLVYEQVQMRKILFYCIVIIHKYCNRALYKNAEFFHGMKRYLWLVSVTCLLAAPLCAKCASYLDFAKPPVLNYPGVESFESPKYWFIFILLWLFKCRFTKTPILSIIFHVCNRNRMIN